MASWDVVIIGSGFGGAVMAARLSEYLAEHKPGARVLVIEKGKDHTGSFDPEATPEPKNAQGNRFRNTLAPQYTQSISEAFTDTRGAFRAGVPSMNVICGIGVGGGS